MSPATSCTCAAATTATTRATGRDSPDVERFAGELVHPQFWPEDLDYAGKRVVVIGSGATAVTLVPALTDQAAHVTMLQRSPTYILSIPSEDPIANGLRRVLGDRRAYPIARWKNVAISTLVYQLSQRRPKLMRSLLRRGVHAPAAGGLRRRHPLQPDLRAVGPAAVPGARRRPVPRDQGRPGVGRHRPDRALHADRRAAGVRRRARRRHHRHRDRAEPAGDRRRRAVRRRRRRCHCPSGWPTRA